MKPLYPFLCVILLFIGCQKSEDRPRSTTSPSPPIPTWSLKLVNEDVSDHDLVIIHDLGITMVSGEWGISDSTAAGTLTLLDRLHTHQLKLVMNFADGSAWGYQEDGTDSDTQVPAWQGKQVQAYVKVIKDHPALYGYDISNEAGENLPNGDRFRLTVAQLTQAAATIREVDSTHPLLLRMHYWDEEDGDFGSANPSAPGIVDVVMLNLYSNYTRDEATPALPNMVPESGQKLVDKILAVDPQVEVWVALGAFREEPLFLAPTPENLKRDLIAAQALQGITNIGFFGWGPERYPSEGEGWYLPRDGAELLKVIGEATVRQVTEGAPKTERN